LILEALQRGITGIGDAIEEALTAEKAITPEEAMSRAERAVNKHVKIDPTALADTVKNLYGDSALRSTKYAIKQMGGAGIGANLDRLVAGVNWDNWKPGSDAVALSQYPSVLKDLLDSSYLLAEGVTKTTKKRVAQQVADGIRTGADYRTVSKNINAIINDPLRAEVIAITETNRAFNRASIIAYSSGGAKKWNWVVYEGACDKCASKAGIDFSVTDPEPPLHPDCRCGVTPVLAGAGNLDLGPNIPTIPTPPIPTPPTTPTPPVPTPPTPRHPINPQAVINDTTPEVIQTDPTKLPEVERSYVKFVDHDEARQFFDQRDIALVDFETIDKQIIEELASAMQDGERRYGAGAFNNIDSFGVETAGIEGAYAYVQRDLVAREVTARAGERNYSAFGPSAKALKLRITPKYATDYTKTNESLKSDLTVGRYKKRKFVAAWGSGGDVYGLWVHELAHVVQGSTEWKSSRFVGTSFSGLNTMDPKNNPFWLAMRAAGYLTKGFSRREELIVKDVSQYAFENPLEFNAEATALFAQPAKFNALPLSTRQRLLKYQAELNALAQRTILKTEETDDNALTRDEIMALSDWDDCTFDGDEIVSISNYSLRPL
jgi:SPP1 gp7 family putative phage head morphogenesis protein